MMTTFNSDKLAMALYLTVLAIVNFFFVYSSVDRVTSVAGPRRRRRRRRWLKQQQQQQRQQPQDHDDHHYVKGGGGEGEGDPKETTANDLHQKNESRAPLSHAVLAMSLFDIPWIYLCMVQCWNNTFNGGNKLDQSNGNDSFGCNFMGWYMGFGLIAMMGSHCLVAYYLRNYLLSLTTTHPLPCHNNSYNGMSTVKSVWMLAFGLFIVASCFASIPLWQGDGYRLTNAGFCYPDFTQPLQSGIMLGFVLVFLSLATVIWYQIGRVEFWCKYYLIFVVTWSFWIPACSYGMAVGKDIPPPYLIIAAFLSHGNALANSFLYGMHLFQILDRPNIVHSLSSSSSSGKKKETFMISGNRIVNVEEEA